MVRSVRSLLHAPSRSTPFSSTLPNPRTTMKKRRQRRRPMAIPEHEIAAVSLPRGGSSSSSRSSSSSSWRRSSSWLIPLAVTALNLASNLGIIGGVVIAPRNCGGAVKHVTIAVGPDPSASMIVTFASIPSTFAAPVGGVLVGTSPSKLDRLALEDDPPTHYSVVSAHHGSKDPYHSPYYHHVTITGLQPNTHYYYKPVVQANTKEFDKYNLLLRKTAPPSPASPTRPDDVTNHASEPLENDNEEEEDDKDDLLQDFEDAVQDDTMDASDRRFLLENVPYDGSAKQCPSADKIRSFKTAPLPGPDAVVNLAICGDIGQFPHSEELLSRMLRSKDDIDALILAGDIAYASLDQRRWDTFLDFLDDYPIPDSVPMMIVPGNHDIEKQDNGTDMFQAYENRFRMPRVHPPIQKQWDGAPGPFNMDKPPYPLPYEWGNAYYAFTYGSARVIMISAYSSMELNSTQYKWIESELQAVDRTVTPWVLAVLHTPIYNTFSLHQRDPQILAAKTHLEPLFVDHRVNMVFTGHVHAYMRTTTVAHNVVDPTGPMHVTVGAGGRKCEAPFLNEVPEPWLDVRDATVYGFGMFRIVNRTHAEWDWVHTGHNDKREYNQLFHSNATLPAGPGRDRVVVTNQYYL